MTPSGSSCDSQLVLVEEEHKRTSEYWHVWVEPPTHGRQPDRLRYTKAKCLPNKVGDIIMKAVHCHSKDEVE